MTGLFRVPYVLFIPLTYIQRLAFAATGVDSAWEQYKLEAGKMLENGDESHLSSARGVGRLLIIAIVTCIVALFVGSFLSTQSQ